ncbi:hypothetical protein PPACK8108_LOCUS9760 [Phakopsora pachyrhizi]|uniref:Uncharacterized protein n=1 Tax=Phakopsora pachyrhizi TaxID=170000 RepID=A0AAV0AZS8_PHAPC|nr:hypothetical protein PPACK8108_LOCUS9760 [Phakopsora pachyrhizi]
MKMTERTGRTLALRMLQTIKRDIYKDLRTVYSRRSLKLNPVGVGSIAWAHRSKIRNSHNHHKELVRWNKSPSLVNSSMVTVCVQLVQTGQLQQRGRVIKVVEIHSKCTEMLDMWNALATAQGSKSIVMRLNLAY